VTNPWLLQCPARGPGLRHVRSAYCDGTGEHAGHNGRVCCECGQVPSVPGVGPAELPSIKEPKLRERTGADEVGVDITTLTPDEMECLWHYVIGPERKRGYR
jgi:hypothetical protein